MELEKLKLTGLRLPSAMHDWSGASDLRTRATRQFGHLDDGARDRLDHALRGPARYAHRWPDILRMLRLAARFDVVTARLALA